MSREQTRDLEDLLEPTLAGARPAQPPYSIRAQLIVAILGGVFAAVPLCAASSRRIGSLRRDLWIYAAASLGGAAWIVALTAHPELTQAWGTRAVRYGQQLLAVALVGAFYVKNRAVYKAMEIAGEQESPSPWGPGIGAVLGGGLCAGLLALLGRSLGG
jgi:hypothetical protein